MKIPQNFQGAKFKEAKVTVAVTATHNCCFEKNLFASEIGLYALRGSNETTKTFKFNQDGVKVKFDVIVRIREAFSGKEMCEQIT